MSIDDDIRAMAVRQRSVVLSEQLAELGLTNNGIRHRVRDGSLVRIAPRVLVVGGAPVTAEMRLFAAWLECGGLRALSHGTAAAHWRFPGFKALPIEVLRARDGVFPPVSLARVHTTRELPDTQVVDHDGLLITTPARTLLDLAPRVHPGKLERLLDRAWSHRQVNWAIMQRTFRELQSRGRPGIAVMRELLDARPVDYVPPASGLEARFQKVLRDGGLPELDRQVNVGNDVRWLGRVDFIDRERKMIVEVQSDLHHTSLSDLADDAARRVAMEAAGWLFVEVDDFEVWHRPDVVRARVTTARTGR
jgi:very-short-patch-repair endonuclease